MRIPRADEVFGWRRSEQVSTIAPAVPDNFVQQGLARVQGAVQGIADTERRKDEIEQAKIERAAEIEQQKRDRQREKEADEAQRKLEQAEREKEHSRIQTDIINMRSAYDTVAQEIYADKDIPDDRKLNVFESRAGEIKAKVAEGLPSDKQHLLEPVHAEAMFHVKAGLANQREKEAVDQARANGLQSIEALQLQAAKSPRDRMTALAMFDSMDLYGYSEQEKAKLREAFVQSTAQNEVTQRMNAGEHQQLLKDLAQQDKDGAPQYLPELDPKTRESFVAAIQTDIVQEKRRREAEIKAAARERKADARDALADIKDSFDAGLPVDPQDIVRAGRLAAGDKDLERKFKKVIERGTSFQFNQQRSNEDPLGYGAARMGIRVAPISLAAGPEALAEQMKQRLEIGKKVQAGMDLRYAPVLLKDEVKALTGMMQQQKDGGAGTIASMTKIFGKDAMLGVARQVSAEDPQAGMAIAYTVQGKGQLAAAISEGSRYLKDKALKLPKGDELRSTFNDKIRDGMQGLPQTQEAQYQAFEKYYAYLAANKGLTDGEKLDGKLVDQAFRQTVGEVAKVNGKRVVLPDGYTESRFLNNVKAITPEIIEAAGGVQGLSNTQAAALIRSDGRWAATSRPNVYRVEVAGRWLQTGQNNYLELEFPK